MGGVIEAGGVLKRLSNSASDITGRVRPVRLSGPGMPPRRVLIALLLGMGGLRVFFRNGGGKGSAS